LLNCYSITTIIRDKDYCKNDKEDEWGYKSNFSEDTLAKMKFATVILKMAQIYVERIDWLISGDDDEETFHERLAEDLSELTSLLNKKLD